jgi:translation initiation factor IF-2
MDVIKGFKRPPIVTIMGHVDHGKTTLLDFIRKTKVAEKEHGGITQHIGAYQIENPRITFVDTPGHAAFSQMRARGGKVADLVVLVIAANEGIKPQTRECFEHIREAEVPFLVAINKIDLDGADVEMVKLQLTTEGYPPEDKGGKLVVVPISALSGAGVENLLEMIVLMAELEDLMVSSNDSLEAVVIESKLDKYKGPLASVVVQRGKILLGQDVHAETISGRVKALFDYLGKSVERAEPGDPVQILGFSSVLPVGALVHSGMASDLPVVVGGGGIKRPLSDNDHLGVVLKSDVAGSAEAIRGALPEGVVLMAEAVGNVSEADVLLAKTTGALVVGFNVTAGKSVVNLAGTEGVKIKLFKVIYDLLEFLRDEQQRLIDPLYGVEIFGKAVIQAEFKIKKNKIAGAKLTEGEIKKDDWLMLIRDGKVLKKVKIKTLQQGKLEVDKVSKGGEFGVVFTPFVDFQAGDEMVSYKLS